MGRLFWKVFGFTLLAQIIAALGIGGAIWLKHTAAANQQGVQIDQSPPAAFMIESAASTLHYGGATALRELIGHMDGHREIIALDESGHDILDRAVKPEAAIEARRLLTLDGARPVVRQTETPDGHRYLLFSPALHAEQFGPGEQPLPGEMRNRPRPPMGVGRRGYDHPGGPGDPGGAGGPPPDHDGAWTHLLPFLPFLPIASAVFGSLIFSAILAWYFSKPIQSLRAAFEAVAGGDLAARPGSATGGRRDELADLGRDFDVMVERLRALLGGQKRLLHDISHELRSPLARLQVAIGLARQQPEKLEASLERIERESIRMDKLVGELLTLSKLEAGALKLVMEDVNAEELVANLFDDARFEAQGHEVKVELVGNGAVVIRGDAEMLHSAIENVLRNAIKQTIAGSTVILEVDQDLQRGMLRLLILDRGPGVPEEELEAIFRAFYRSAHAAAGTVGHGLGLAIAHRVIAAHGGSISARNRQGGGLAVEILLPIGATSESPT